MPYFNYFGQMNIIKHFYAISCLSAVTSKPAGERGFFLCARVHLRALRWSLEGGNVMQVNLRAFIFDNNLECVCLWWFFSSLPMQGVKS